MIELFLRWYTGGTSLDLNISSDTEGHSTELS